MNCNPLQSLPSCTLSPNYCFCFALYNLVIQLSCIFGGIWCFMYQGTKLSWIFLFCQDAVPLRFTFCVAVNHNYYDWWQQNINPCWALNFRVRVLLKGAIMEELMRFKWLIHGSTFAQQLLNNIATCWMSRKHIQHFKTIDWHGSTSCNLLRGKRASLYFHLDYKWQSFT